MSNETEFKEAYPFTCVVCGHEQIAQISIFMHMGLNSGHGSCLQCRTFLHLEIQGDRMVSQEWEAWLAGNATSEVTQ